LKFCWKRLLSANWMIVAVLQKTSCWVSSRHWVLASLT
jgi:hypothetical protein